MLFAGQALCREDQQHGQNGQHSKVGQRIYQKNGQVLPEADKAVQAFAKGAGKAAGEGVHRRVGLHFAQADRYGAVIHLIVVQVALRGVAFQLILHLAELRFNGEKVFQSVGLITQLLQAGALGFQTVDAGLHIHIAAGDILGLLAAVGNAADIAHGV